jgi:hypothetical protein
MSFLICQDYLLIVKDYSLLSTLSKIPIPCQSSQNPTLDTPSLPRPITHALTPHIAVARPVDSIALCISGRAVAVSEFDVEFTADCYEAD